MESIEISNPGLLERSRLVVGGKELEVEWQNEEQFTRLVGREFSILLKLDGDTEFIVDNETLVCPVIAYAFYVWFTYWESM